MGLDFCIENEPAITINGEVANEDRAYNIVTGEDPTDATIVVKHQPEVKIEVSAPRWSYSGFMRFRKKLAGSVGIDLDAMHGFGGETSWDDTSTCLRDLLYHSDCDGDLAPEQCAVIAPALREAVAGWESEPEWSYDVDNALRLASYMDVCAAAGRKLVFT